MYDTLKTTTVYRVPTVEDALRLRKHLEKALPSWRVRLFRQQD